MKKCNFCQFRKSEIRYEDKSVWIVDTKDKKGHKERVMVVTKLHTKNPYKKLREYAIKKLIEVGKKIFNYVPAFCILSDRHSRFPNHWYRVASDFRGDNIEQIIDTPFKVIWVKKNWRKRNLKKN